VSEHSAEQGQGPRKGCKGAARKIAARRARLFAAAFVFPQKGHYPRTGALILFNKIIKDLVFPRGFFKGLFTRISCAMCDWLLYYASANVSLIA
jgi:hypothetical protein